MSASRNRSLKTRLLCWPLRSLGRCSCRNLRTAELAAAPCEPCPSMTQPKAELAEATAKQESWFSFAAPARLPAPEWAAATTPIAPSPRPHGASPRSASDAAFGSILSRAPAALAAGDSAGHGLASARATATSCRAAAGTPTVESAGSACRASAKVFASTATRSCCMKAPVAESARAPLHATPRANRHMRPKLPKSTSSQCCRSQCNSSLAAFSTRERGRDSSRRTRSRKTPTTARASMLRTMSLASRMASCSAASRAPRTQQKGSSRACPGSARVLGCEGNAGVCKGSPAWTRLASASAVVSGRRTSAASRPGSRRRSVNATTGSCFKLPSAASNARAASSSEAALSRARAVSFPSRGLLATGGCSPADEASLAGSASADSLSAAGPMVRLPQQGEPS
mmetsp:Transcript_53196/g.158526  ORF Transcript_53196/g.158526 Transcript_53196/m.158526 type:complete len:399 (-) Transcript_53196:10-1206(-)